jgi:membrane-associated phospholipid phosphatase
MRWQLVALGFVSYLALAAWTRREFAPARRRLLAAAALAWAAFAVALAAGRAGATLFPFVEVLLPALVLLAGYWLSGLLFVRTDLRVERWLQTIDDVLLHRTGVLAWVQQAPRAVAEYFELSYLLVYAVVPAGAVTLALAGHFDQVPRFWATVLLAEFICYGMLPWIQTRPPRVLENAAAGRSQRDAIRSINLGIADRASIQANTIPSGHAAGAAAVALAVGSTMPAAGGVFLVLALSIAVATVIGRYHYAVDSILGVLVAAAVWMVV